MLHSAIPPAFLKVASAEPPPAAERRYRVLLVCSHAVQYAVPLFREMAKHPKLDVLVAFCSLLGSQPMFDPGFGVQVAWDIPLLEGYPWVHVPHRLVEPRFGREAHAPLLSAFFRLINPGLWPLVRKGNFDAVLTSGYAFLSYWIAILAAKFSGVPVILISDAVELDRDGKGWKVPIKKFLLPWAYRLPEAVCVLSSAGITFVRGLGIPQDKIFLTHYTVDNHYFQNRAEVASRVEVRRGWNIPPQAPVVLFCGKLSGLKSPQDLLRAFARARLEQAYLVYAGDGPLRRELEAEARRLGVGERVRFLGFVNQSRLPEVYAASDLLVLPSKHEPFGLVVNEAMCCGLPVVVSDRVGARMDLVEGYETGFVYPAGDLEALARILGELLPDRGRLGRMGEAARKRMETWSFREHVEGLVHAVEAVGRRRDR
jgi:glycosyltransferase involved in cell wall biosynthesis